MTAPESKVAAPVGGVATLDVTAAQAAQIESAWAICSYGNGRKAISHWSRTFRECVAEVLGYEPPDAFTLRATGAAS